MTVTLTGDNSLFQRLGKLFGYAKAVRTHQANLETKLEGIIGEYSSADSYMVSELSKKLDEHKAQAGLILQDIKVACEKTLVEMVHADTELRTKDVQSALEELISQMVGNNPASVTASIKENVVLQVSNTSGFSPWTTSETGNGALHTHWVPPDNVTQSADEWPNVRPELVRFKCAADSNEAGVTSGRELFDVVGEAEVDRLHWDWPKGSGYKRRVNVTAASSSGGIVPGDNLLVNSNFETFSSNTPTNWTIATGAAATDVFEHTSTYYRGSKCLELRGTASTTLTSLTQALNSSTIGTGPLKAAAIYYLGMKIKRTTTLSAGTIELSVQNAGESSAIGSLTCNIAHGSITTSWQEVKIISDTPVVIPAGAKVRIKATADMANAEKIVIDEVILARMHQIGSGGPSYILLAGSADFAKDDEFRVLFSNDVASNSEFALEFDRFFNMYDRGLALPAEASEDIDDSAYF